MPDPVPLSPPVPIVPFDHPLTALYIDQFGQNRTINPEGGQFNFPNPDLPGNARILLTGVVNWAPGLSYTTVYDIQIVIQKVSVVRTLIANAGAFTNIQTVKVPSLSMLPESDFGQFVISACTALGAPFDPWRIVVISSASNYIVLGFMDNQDKTRISNINNRFKECFH